MPDMFVDPDGDPLTLTVGSAGYGTVTMDDSNVIYYTPNGVYIGLDEFTYTLTDPFGASSTGIITIDIYGDVPSEP